MNTTSKRANSKKPKKTLVDRVYHEIQNRILYNIWGTGYQALEQELSEELGVSRTPVREALIRLQRDGLVKVVPRHGMRVLPMSPADVRDTYQILSSLESLAVELAAKRKPAAKEFEPSEKANLKMKKSFDASDLKAWAQADEAFHFHLVELSGNRILTDVHENFWSRAQRARLSMLSLINPPARSTMEHTLLLEAIRQGDPSLSRERLAAHLEHIVTYASNLKEPERNILLQR